MQPGQCAAAEAMQLLRSGTCSGVDYCNGKTSTAAQPAWCCLSVTATIRGVCSNVVMFLQRNTGMTPTKGA
jgi:hypothetical protein